MLIINYSLNKRFCKKVFDFNISFFKKCYVHDIFIINFHNIMNYSYSNIFYSFNIFIGMLPHPTQPTFLFFSFLFPSIFPQPQELTLHLAFVFFLFFFLYFPPPPCTSSPWSSLFFSFSLNSTPHSSHLRTSSPWSSQVISLNFTKNLQYLSLFVTLKPNGNWSQIDASELLLITQPQPCRKIQIGLLRVRLVVEVLAYYSYYFLCLSFWFSVYFVVSEMRVI